MQFTLHCFLKTATFSRQHFVNILARLAFDARLEARPSFEEHLKMILSKLKKTTGFSRKMRNQPPRSALSSIYNAFVLLHLGYGDIIYDEAYNASFHQMRESLNIIPA